MSETITLTDGIRLTLRRSARARRLTLRVPRHGGDAVLTLPAHVSAADGRAFAESHRDWLARATARQIQPVRVGHGTVLPVAGQSLTVTPAPVRSASIAPQALLVPQSRPAGPVVQAFLKHLALERLRPACDRHAASLGRAYRTIALRDTRSRWGSCSSDGRLMFSWRLAMAPPEVLNYVAAHEVAHLVHMDHSPHFWAQVAALMPDYRPHRKWLRDHAGQLHGWQFR